MKKYAVAIYQRDKNNHEKISAIVVDAESEEEAFAVAVGKIIKNDGKFNNFAFTAWHCTEEGYWE
ncbi:unnamed protein product [marine sediment metagenome]|uniref:Uncharacterized protein n=1 Tax=marine sediment metagenome TaxID=412755 RepID=X0UZN5_9ZZZZ